MAEPPAKGAPRILVLGKNGLVARALVRNNPAILCIGRDEGLDLRRPETIGAALDHFRPSVVINAAAQANVDEAERSPDDAFVLNHFGALAAANACAARDIGIIHLSTDYVFGGQPGAPYTEDASPAPINAYGRSKAAGEAAVLASGARAAVVRPAWVFAADGGGFLPTLLKRAQTGAPVRVAADQFGCPTCADDLAGALSAMANRLAARDPAIGGILHFAGQGGASRAEIVDYAAGLARARGVRLGEISQAPAASFPSAAPRPRDTRLSTAATVDRTGIAPRPWQNGVARLVATLFPD